jgi:hypothetical protein
VADIASCVWKLEVSHWPHIGGTVQECGVLISICPIIVLKMTQNFFTLTIGGWLLCQPQLCCMILQTHRWSSHCFVLAIVVPHSPARLPSRRSHQHSVLLLTTPTFQVSCLMIEVQNITRASLSEWICMNTMHSSMHMIQLPCYTNVPLSKHAFSFTLWLVAKIQDLGRDCLDHLQQNFLCERQSLSYDHSVSTINFSHCFDVNWMKFLTGTSHLPKPTICCLHTLLFLVSEPCYWVMA